jgi:tetratricopeptide (TPR) repeat protein
MQFLLIVIISLVALGAIAAIFSIGSSDEPIVNKEDGCASCTSRKDCKLVELKEESRRKREEKCTHHMPTAIMLLLLTSSILIIAGCSTKKNTAQSRFWQSFTARYNTYFNGSQAFIEGNIEKENGNRDNCTELIPLYMVGNKQSRSLGNGNFDRAIEKSQKTIKQHSIKRRPEWNKGRRKTEKDIEWLSRREYNPFLWRAWLLMGKSQFQKGEFEEAAATFSYMTRLYQTQPPILGIARAWLAKSYTELDWLYDAEDVITKQQRDSMDYRAVKDWDYTYADYYIHSQRYEEAIPYLRKVIRHESRKKQKAREWFLMGQLQTLLGHRQQAYEAYKHVIRLNPPYELEFNARIAQTEVLPTMDHQRKIKKLRRMAASDNNKDYLDQVYYAIGNVYLTQKDTLNAIEAYETGCKKATRSGVEKGVLLLTLGNVYWEKEKYADAQRCYGQAIGLLDKDRKDYEQLSERSKILDELAPHTSAVELQDSLQRLAKMPEDERNKIIDHIIEELIKKEKEEQRNMEEAEAERISQQQAAQGGNQATIPSPTLPSTTGSSTWYFYSPQAVNQGKQLFQRLWGKRENEDNWQRINKTVVENTEKQDSPSSSDNLDNPDNLENPDSLNNLENPDNQEKKEQTDSAATNDPHQREYYLAQIPFTEEQLAASDNLIKDGLFHAGIIFKDKLDNLKLSRKYLERLTTQYADYEHNDEALYHLFLLFSRQGNKQMADLCVEKLKQDFPESEWTILLSDPYFAENQRFGVHLEDSLYAATYNAFKENKYQEVKTNTQLSESRFPLGQHRPKFLFIEGLSLLNEGDFAQCTERMKQVVEKYPQSEVSELAGMIIRGVQQGKQLIGGKFDLGDVWNLRDADRMAQDSAHMDTLSIELNVKHVFLLAYQPDSVNQNQLLYEMAKHNFSNYLVRNFEIVTDQDQHGLSRMLISGFLSYDEARQYARQLYSARGMLAELLKHCRSLIVSEQNLPLLGTAFSYADYELFFEKQLAPIKISKEPLLEEPEMIIQKEEEDDQEAEDEEDSENSTGNNGGYVEFDDDFWR